MDEKTEVRILFFFLSGKIRFCMVTWGSRVKKKILKNGWRVRSDPRNLKFLLLTYQNTRDHDDKFLPLCLALKVNSLQDTENDDHVKYNTQYKNIMSKKSLENILR